jgi:hypothetical protein
VNLATPSNSSVRCTDALTYAFRTDGRLDPATKLLDIGLHGYTPVAALRTLADRPMHMSVALHEITHFLSLESTLGHLLSFWAYRTNSLSDGLLHLLRTGKEIDQSVIHEYCWRHYNYRLLIEAWRPLLEGLAVYVQTHRPNDAGDELIAPLSLLLQWRVWIGALSTGILAPSEQMAHAVLDQLSQGLLTTGYRAIREGPGLQLDDRPLAARIEMLEPETLRPYFLGHAYLRAMQRHLVRASPEYESAEKFIGLIFRILRSSTKRLLEGNPRWDRPDCVERVYGWTEAVRRAKPEQVLALAEQDDNVDVLWFLNTGDMEVGYGGMDMDALHDLRKLVPDEWKRFGSELSARHLKAVASGRRSREKRLAMSEDEFAERMAGHWLRATASLNLSTAGECVIGGWIPNGFRTKHALALKLDGRVWWMAASDAELARLVRAPAELRVLGVDAIHVYDADALPNTRCLILIDCFSTYSFPTEEASTLERDSQVVFPRFYFELYDRNRRNDSILVSIVPTTTGVGSFHLEALKDIGRREFHKVSMALRRIVSNAASPRDLALAFERRGMREIGELLNGLASKEDLAASRAEEHVNRRILQTLLGHLPVSEIRTLLLSKGIGMFPESAGLAPVMVAAYGGDAALPGQPLDFVVERIQSVNDRSRRMIGKSLFTWSSRAQRVSYSGLWGDTN